MALRPWNRVFMPNTVFKLVNNPLLSENPNKYVFYVPPKLTKHDIREYLSKIYAMDIEKIKTTNYDGKLKKRGLHYSITAAHKRVEVHVKPEPLLNAHSPDPRLPNPIKERTRPRGPSGRPQWETLEMKRANHEAAKERNKEVFQQKWEIGVQRRQNKELEKVKLQQERQLAARRKENEARAIARMKDDRKAGKKKGKKARG